MNPSIPRDRVHQLATCRFIADARDVMLVGPPGVGKGHLAQALGREAIWSFSRNAAAVAMISPWVSPSGRKSAEKPGSVREMVRAGSAMARRSSQASSKR